MEYIIDFSNTYEFIAFCDAKQRQIDWARKSFACGRKTPLGAVICRNR
jgi:hypothetical protein